MEFLIGSTSARRSQGCPSSRLPGRVDSDGDGIPVISCREVSRRPRHASRWLPEEVQPGDGAWADRIEIKQQIRFATSRVHDHRSPALRLLNPGSGGPPRRPADQDPYRGPHRQRRREIKESEAVAGARRGGDGLSGRPRSRGRSSDRAGLRLEPPVGFELDQGRKGAEPPGGVQVRRSADAPDRRSGRTGSGASGGGCACAHSGAARAVRAPPRRPTQERLRSRG